MKTINKIKLLTLFVLIGLISCDDQLDLQDNDTIGIDTAFQNVNDLRAGIFDLYNNYQQDNLIDISNMTDDTKEGASNGGQKLNFYRWELTGSSFETNRLWLNNYGTINTAYRLLEASEVITIEDGEQDEVNRLKGECYTFSALCHLNLLALYSPEYTSSGIGVPYVDHIILPGDEPARNTFGEVITGMKSDISKAENLISSSQTDNGRITLNYLTFLRAKIAQLEGNTPSAISLSQSLMDQYPLADQTQYTNMFLDQDDTEIIFKMIRTPSDLGLGFTWHFSGGGGFMEMSNSLFNLLEDDDVRKNVLFNQIDSDPSDNLHLINKYPGSTGLEFINNVKMARISEMYLVNAEAKALANNFNGAATIIKQLRDVRFGVSTNLPSYANQLAAITDILLERRLELAYEGHRYLDVKRLKEITGLGFSRNVLDCQSAPCVLQANDQRFTFPIPLGELDANSNMVQNPGY